MDLVLKPYRVATSKPAQKTYIQAILYLISSVFLLGLAVLAYGLFYFSYVPQMGIERTIHLQYGDGPHPYGITPLSSTLISQQPYDISVMLHVPRSPSNLEAGNFMLSLTLLSPDYKPPPFPAPPPKFHLHGPPPSPLSSIPPAQILHHTRRPTIIPYTSPLISLSTRLFYLPLYLLSFRTESSFLSIPLSESVSFPKGRANLPGSALLELQSSPSSTTPIQVYSVQLKITARFGGLRWWMWNHRILSAFVGTGAFWTAECVFAILGWVTIQYLFRSQSQPEHGRKEELTAGDITTTRIKEEEEIDTDESPDLSDTPRTFPTYGRQAPLRYSPPKEKITIKTEPEDNEFEGIQPEADDEEEEDDDDDDGEGRIGGSWKGKRKEEDSGIGTSFSEGGVGVGGLSRRRSKGGGGKGGTS